MKRKIIFIILSTFFVYLNSIKNPFIFDDYGLIVENSLIKSFKFFKEYFTKCLFEGAGKKTTFYRPLQTISYALIYKISKLSPVGYHILNISLHTFCAILIFILLKEIYSEKISFLVSLLWAIHPINTEGVTYISGTADPLFLFFGLLGIYLYILYLSSKKYKFLFFSLLSFILSLLSKESSVLILPLFFLYLYCSEKIKKEEIKNYAIITSIFFIYLILRKIVLNFGEGLPEDIFLHRFYTAFVAFLTYISILIFPFILSMERHIPYIKTPKNIDFIIGLFFFIISLFLLYKKRKDKKILFPATLFLLNFLFHSNIFIPLNGNLREHWMYLGSIGFFILFISSIEKIKKEKIEKIILILILSLYSTRTILRNYDWGQPIKFYEKSIEYGFKDKKMFYNLASAYLYRNEYEKALKMFKFAENLYGNKKIVYQAIAICYYKLGDMKEAKNYYEKALKIDPYDPVSLTSLATIYYNTKEKEVSEIIKMLKLCIMKNPFYSYPYLLLGIIFYEKGDYKESIEYLKIANTMKPEDDISQSLLGMSYFYTGNIKEAEKYLNNAYNLKPDKWENIQNLAFFYKTTGNYKKAIPLYEKLIQIKKNDPDILNDLGLCYAMIGEKGKAKNIWEEIINKNPDYKPAKENLKILLNQK